MDLCWQSNVCFLICCLGCFHSFSSKEQVSFNFMAAVTIYRDRGAPQNKVWHYLQFPIYFSWRDGTRCHDLHFLNVEFWANFFTLLFHFHQDALCAIRVVSSAYLRLLIFLLANLIPAYASFSSEFRMMYSAYKLNEQGDNIQPWRTPFPL